jgi:outer membrane receptor protein involved in Fe transport
MKLSFSVRNLFDRAYADPSSEEHLQLTIPQNGRTWYIGLEYRLKSKASPNAIAERR